MATPVEPRGSGRDWVALILAVGIATAVNLLMFAVLWDALRSDTPGLSENATQVMIAAFGGIIGVLGSYVGARGVERAQRAERETVDNGTAPLEAPERPLEGP